jgi:hypothetical protein
MQSSLGTDYPHLKVEQFNAANLSNKVRGRIPMAHLSDDPIFVVDPFGNIMLYFTSEHDYKSQMSDIKKLLKLSTIG